MAEIKKNFGYNLILTMGNYIFPLLTYPYVSRVLGVSNIGAVNYIDGIIDYCILFCALGVGSLGVREIAKVKDNQSKINEVYSSLFAFNLILTIVGCGILTYLSFCSEYFRDYREFLWVGILKLFFYVFSTEWFFQGLSNFKFITTRSLIVRTLFVVSIFIFVRTKEDVVIYYLLFVLMPVINAIINFIYSRKFVKFSISSIHINTYLVAIISYGFYRILTSMYTTFNVVYLGSVTNVEQVGFFSTSTKIYFIIMSVFSAFTTVMVPKVSELLSKQDSKALSEISYKTFDAIFMVSVPMIVGLYIYAPLVINLIAGPGFEGAIIPFKIVMLLLLVIALEQVIIQQFLMAKKDSKCIVILSSIGATIGILLNIVLTEKYGAIGSAISWTCSEIAILIVSLFFFKKHFNLSLPLRRLLISMALSIPYILICYSLYTEHITWHIFVSLMLCLMWFLISNIYIYKNDILLETIKSVSSRLIKK
jgi:O-antigen/teichoic acid export membrane protein